MKKIFVLCLMIVLAVSCFAFVGCSGNDDVARQGIVYKCKFDYDGDGDTETKTIKRIAVGEKMVDSFRIGANTGTEADFLLMTTLLRLVSRAIS